MHQCNKLHEEQHPVKRNALRCVYVQSFWDLYMNKIVANTDTYNITEVFQEDDRNVVWKAMELDKESAKF